ncbi:LlaMI family restriction endonuclease [Candidatus Kaiserbacteria bacterium]|nr:LlaMI family restriction endonuclease [Candidatus Kaiserbacteria bacterium]MCB9811322.1 LlaMI family restriction endonuclease [Candidatus Nomurabacteria bacterium]
MNTDKKKIIDLFNKNVRGKSSDTNAANVKHAGKEGHWLETQMGIARNASNTPDLFGYEMKNHTSQKTTFGDWSASCYIWHDKTFEIQRDDFLRIFGKPNLKKGGRYSWSGEPIPKIDQYNNFGQILLIDDEQNIVIEYSFSHDQRENKSTLIPSSMQQEHLILARWNRDWMKAKVERKFNQKGWFKCLKNNEGVYSKIVFGEPMTYENWLEGVREGLIFFDSGMYQTNPRNYSQWRAYNAYWDNLVIESY